MRIPGALVFFLCFGLPALASAQPFPMPFRELNSIVLFHQRSWPVGSDQLGTRDSSFGAYGFGTEFLFDLVDGERASIELGLGYGQLTGFVADEASLDLRGSLRSFPTVSVYVSTASGRLRPYGSLHSGLLDFWHMQAYDPEGRQYTLSGSIFEAGISGGAWVLPGLFAELSYRFRRFPGVTWGLPSGVPALPAEWPRSLDFSGLVLNVGLQVRKPDP